MGDPVTWPYFDEGYRPPTMFEFFQEWAETCDYRLISIDHSMVAQSGFGGLYLEEVNVKIAVSGVTLKRNQTLINGVPEFERPEVIGMQGPGIFRATRTVDSSFEMNHDVYEFHIRGAVYYG